MATRGARVHRPKEADAAMARGAHLKQTVAKSYVDEHGEKYTDEALAERACVSVNTVRNLWKGSGAELGTLLGVATASGMSILDLLMAMQGRPGSTQGDPVERIAVAMETISRSLIPVTAPPRPAEPIAPEDLRWIVEQTAAALAREPVQPPKPVRRQRPG